MSELQVHNRLALRATVERLLASGRPATVARFVVSVIVDAVNGVVGGRTRPHISQERGEVIAPAVAHGDASPAVIRPALDVRVVTAVLEADPGRVFHGLPLAAVGAAVAMLRKRGRHKFVATTPAGRNSNSLQIASANGPFAAAVATTDPVSVPPGYSSAVQNYEAAVSVATQISETHEAIIARPRSKSTVFLARVPA
jgi:hypothetical protein